MKVCIKCNIEKSLGEFSKNKAKKDGKNSSCKNCNHQWYLNNKEKSNFASNQWRLNHVGYHKEYKKQWYLNNKEYTKQYYQDNKEKIYKRQKKYESYKRQTDLLFKLSDSIRSLTYDSFKRTLNGTYKKGKRTEAILGCTVSFLIEHLQSQFTEGMTLENHGTGPGCWNIDHKTPISSAVTEEDIYKLSHYTNLQPLWYEDNMKKFNKIL